MLCYAPAVSGAHCRTIVAATLQIYNDVVTARVWLSPALSPATTTVGDPDRRGDNVTCKHLSLRLRFKVSAELFVCNYIELLTLKNTVAHFTKMS